MCDSGYFVGISRCIVDIQRVNAAILSVTCSCLRSGDLVYKK